MNSHAQFRRLLNVLAGEKLIFMFEGYFDESGDIDSGDRVFCVAGYYIKSDDAIAMDAKWGDLLQKYNLAFFRMSDCAHGNGVFKGIPSDVRAQCAAEFIHLIKRYATEGFASIVNGTTFAPSDEFRDPYSLGVSLSVNGLMSALWMNDAPDQLSAYFFEAGHKNRGSALQAVADRVEKYGASVSFEPKKKVRLLQAADLLAWQSQKYAKDCRFNKRRPMRADFCSLTEHPHIFMYVHQEASGIKKVSIEAWPLGRRGPVSVNFERTRDRAIPSYRRDGAEPPIIFIQDVIGWRACDWDNVVQVGFIPMSGFKQRQDFSLILDEKLLQTTIVSLLNAYGVYAGNQSALVIPVSDLQGRAEQSNILVIAKQNGGGRFGMRMTKDEGARLLDALRKALGRSDECG